MGVTITVHVDDDGKNSVISTGSAMSADGPVPIDFEPIWAKLVLLQRQSDEAPFSNSVKRANAEGILAGAIEMFGLVSALPPSEIVAGIVSRLGGVAFGEVGVITAIPEPKLVDADTAPTSVSRPGLADLMADEWAAMTENRSDGRPNLERSSL